MIVVRYQTGNFGDKAKLLQYQMMQRSGGYLGKFVVRSLSDLGSRGLGRKIKMEPENTPLEEENHLNQIIIFRFYVNLCGCRVIAVAGVDTC